MRDHSADQTVRVRAAVSSFTILAMGPSFSPSLVPLCMSFNRSLSSPAASTLSSAWTAKNPGVKRVMSELSPVPVQWSAHLDRASSFSMHLPGRWWSKKSNRARNSDQWACRQLSFLANMKYHPWQETLHRGQNTHKHTHMRKLIAASAA